ncbi:sporulation histidine kinase inhibitor Sda [Paenibacillus sp. GCM10023248]|uniref:sporulation histidine kinase inhibitor Sda n=1 Tax=Bacillales TaxID=1385 RepID=UPI002379FFB3|nr:MULTISPECIES: sporulation histidine kinase inhibitor Sda [Bacillales]MDD9271409.1 sporulation histidine kinase inhibitor Sda [Paenibacillus sp. MAHUQ-63]MDR6884376.1 hypothetical protein [Bacillus sp. 3255]
MLQTLSRQGLIDAYLSAMDLQLEQAFVDLLRQELHRRNIALEGLTASGSA